MLPRDHACANAINGAATAERRHSIEDHFRNSAGRATGVADPTIQSMDNHVRCEAGRSFAHG
ncbi:MULTISPECIES: hypothetical protein [Bradyrhizobium]|uniref:hypothetical protein n=1 Tax=Bradyrhizobium elkanii TaxID=29448 RepID=UPI000418DFEC|nr:hypothetical protein [Bradyrhizobium elkanii]